MHAANKLGIVATSLGLAASAGYGLRVYAEGAPTMAPLFYAGTLEADGKLAEGAYKIALTLVDSEMSEQALCSSVSAGTPVVAGRFRVEVAAECVKLLRDKPDLWARIKFTNEQSGATHELPKASKIGAVPYAMEAQHAVSATTAQKAVSATNAEKATSAAAADTATLATAASAIAAASVTIESGANVCKYISNAYTDCTCPAGSVAIGGGGCVGPGCGTAAAAIVESMPVTANTWRVSCENSAGTRVACLATRVLCLKAR